MQKIIIIRFMKKSKSALTMLFVVCSISVLFSQKRNSNQNLVNKGFQLVALAGYGQRLAKIPDGFDSDVNDYPKSLRKGFTLNAEGNYYFNDTCETGLKYSFFSSNKDFSSSGFGPFIRDEIQIHNVALKYFYAGLYNLRT
ncbi:hypothetical protein R3X28_10680 [Maribacter sp. TH_r10]|uniref:hypothetical protein n=1 Tax=Maribacter sp. TH_r10 TaxID=3082086 RepID=UPI002955D9FC|nr:hypothetical protein [Maribacter sp. TH_r10]MDV7139344.1 hypothetical protein [Maribacter sp. TH_r10]